MFFGLLFFLFIASTTTAVRSTTATLGNDDLNPWLLHGVDTFSPSGRPGNSPYSTLNVTIEDPNTIILQSDPAGDAIFPPVTANCSAQWSSPETVPRNVDIPCTPIEYGTWTFRITPGSGKPGLAATEDFGLEFRLVRKKSVLHIVHEWTFEGGGKFTVGENISGECGGSGVCEWSLDRVPVEMQQSLVNSSSSGTE